MVALAALSLVAGCFGDWVRARARPRREAPSSSTAADSTGEAAPADPCAAYLDAVASHCDEVLEGRPHSHGCHGEIVRVMALYQEGDEPGYHQPHPIAPGPERDRACTQHLRALPRPDPPPDALELGPRCQAWARSIRERCVAPLASTPPDLGACDSDLLAFESIMGGITFGRAAEYEPLCDDGLRQRAEPVSP